MAVQHAHERGVLHRDLKPANILLSDTNEPAITDFGLAKQIDSDRDLTKTGLVMGTPGFMAPEQASGRKDITTSADIFSLGAILYWLITGDTPFAGETPFQTVMNTIEGETPSIRMADPSASADLDLICKKAMHKDPGQRYSSAAAFADDLQAWLSGELLSIRAPTAMSLATIWIRKNMRMILGACVSGLVCGVTVGILVIMSQLKSAAVAEHQFLELGGSSQTWVSALMGLRHMNEGWNVMQFLIIPIVAVCGFSCVLLIRPQTKEANYVSAVTAGLVAGIFAFLIGVGWGPIRDFSVEKGSNDIELLSTAIWLESEQEKKLAQQAFFQRYPGLENMTSDTKQRILANKIKHDQTVGIIPGLWWAVAVIMLLISFPLVATIVLSGQLWQEGFRGWHWFGCTWERCAYCLLFFLVTSFCIRNLVPSVWLIAGALAYYALGLHLAVMQTHWLWRVLMVPGCFLVMFAVNWDIDRMRQSWQLSGRATTDAELESCLVQNNRLLEQLPDRSYNRFQTAIGWLYVGNEEEYQRHCRELFNGFENAYRPEVASRIAKACLLRPDLQDPNHLPQLYEFSEFASSFESDNLIQWFLSTRALAELRRSNPEFVLQLNKRNTGYGSGNAYMLAMVFALDALAHIELNDHQRAREKLQKAVEYCNSNRSKAMDDGMDSGWVNYRVFQILEREVNHKLQTSEQN